ncbi:Glutamyl-tRNA amidotransferase B subunit [Dacryopinax primogenitus]|uniref:Glutamyl-tRNA(Gln) amidotransferase subunit B, mitochondrial n=1 Tax=Dacryopinax primogenitus (strain DJM 731) TaxID=1858805 RepID=M5G4I8_DACPD|nr:Glutamyl-tRNA amidotransferase B subunit [Dacryopinax primogenitus]EJU03145.1 Glutamyl-tRNA amidotransferase B subunit [Dacryopinax primogenitus]
MLTRASRVIRRFPRRTRLFSILEDNEQRIGWGSSTPVTTKNYPAFLKSRNDVPDNLGLQEGKEEGTDERWPGWQPVIGIEVHAQIRARRKLFSDTVTDVDAPPNSHVSLFDAAFPGTLPILNKACVDLGVRTAVALGSDIHERSSFDRKHYFYADLPSGYQITQHYSPLATGGKLSVTHTDKKKCTKTKDIRINQIQLEQDTAKSTTQPGVTLIDLNRAGAPLMEIVSEPDMRSPEQAGAYVTELRALLRAIGASNGNMEEGSLRCDVNVSVHKPGEPFGTRCEIKNLNTIKGLQIAINSEVRRQIVLLSSGQTVAQETRGFDEDRAETFTLRSKEDAPDYRYMPDPNLPPLILTEDYIRTIEYTTPPTPQKLRHILLSIYEIPERDAKVLMNLRAGSDVPFDGELKENNALSYFLDVTMDRDPKVVANWMVNELLGSLAYRKETFTTERLPADQLGEIIDMVDVGGITATSGKALLRHILAEPTREPLTDVVDRLGLRSTGTDGLQHICQAAVDKLPLDADSARKGNTRVIKRLVGEVMRQSKGRVDALAAAVMLRQMLGLPPEDK